MRSQMKHYFNRYFGSATLEEKLLYQFLYVLCFSFLLGKYMDAAGIPVLTQMVANIYFYIAIPVFYFGIKVDGKWYVEKIKALPEKAEDLIRTTLSTTLKRIGVKIYEMGIKIEKNKTE